jgi:hypothetical protein
VDITTKGDVVQRVKSKYLATSWREGEVERVDSAMLYRLLTTQLGRLASARRGELVYEEWAATSQYCLDIAMELRKRGDQLRLV